MPTSVEDITASHPSLFDLPTRFQSQDMSVILESAYDDDMKKYKYKCNNPKYVRMEKIADLVYQKKLQNKSKYTAKSRINKTALPVTGGTVSITLNSNKKKTSNFDINGMSKKITAKSKFKMKWKTIQWLIQNKKDAIHQLFTNYQVVLKFAKGKREGMNRSEFQELLSYVGLGADINLADKLFYIFDADSSGTVDYKELIMGLEVFKEDSVEDKMKVFFDLCDVDGSGGVSEKEVYGVLKQNIVHSDDRIKLKKTITKMFQECDINGDGVLDKDEVLQAAKSNVVLRQLLEQSVRNVQQIDKLIDNDLKEPFEEFVPISSNFVTQKEGVFFPFCDELMKAVKEREDIYDINKRKRQVIQTVFQDEEI